MKGNTIFITGGASGIGLGLCERLIKDNTVIICGRKADRLDAVKERFPEVHTRVCDIAIEKERVSMFQWVIQEFPKVNYLINNAGIIRRDLTFGEDNFSWTDIQEELEVNLQAPIHLCKLFATHFCKQQNAGIINVTSGLSFTPCAQLPVYSATKAAMHSFTLSLRHQLARRVRVIELIPPPVTTGGQELNQDAVPVDEYLDFALKELKGGANEISYKFSQTASRASRAELDQIFEKINPNKYDPLNDFHGL